MQRVNHFIKLKRDKKYRYEKKSLLIEGKTLIKELLPHHLIKTILTTDPSFLPSPSTFIVSSSIIEKITSLETSEGVIAEVAMPSFTSLKDKKRLVALDGVQDPGNLGTLLRSALAFGCEGAILLPGCVDPFNDKAIRAARGATFFLPLQQGLQEITHPKLIATLEGTRPEALPKMEHFVLILGNEAHGPSPLWEGEKISLPMHPSVESLNVGVAGSILLYLLCR